MASDRLSASRLADYLAWEPPQIRKRVLALRHLILKTAPAAAEAVKFGCLCYYEPEARFGAIGGSICMIEVRDDPDSTQHIALSFIHGVGLPDPHALLRGRAKAKRFVPIVSDAEPKQAHLAQLVRAAWKAARRRTSEVVVGNDGDRKPNRRRN